MKNEKIIKKAIDFIVPIDSLLNGHRFLVNLVNGEQVIVTGSDGKLVIERDGYSIFFIAPTVNALVEYFEGEKIDSVE